VCTKCHIPLDANSKGARADELGSNSNEKDNIIAGPVNPGTTRSHHYRVDGKGVKGVDSASYTFDTGASYTGSKLIFLFK
jgi:hypothetical protein